MDARDPNLSHTPMKSMAILRAQIAVGAVFSKTSEFVSIFSREFGLETGSMRTASSVNNFGQN